MEKEIKQKPIRCTAKRYFRAEKVRNWVYKKHFTEGITVLESMILAAAKFKVSQSTVHSYVYLYKYMYYGANIRHEPIEKTVTISNKQIILKRDDNGSFYV